VDARRLVEAASGRDGAELWDALGDPAPDRARRRLADMTERRRGGEPLQYVTGSWGFRRLDLMVDRRVLIPRPETEVVVEVALGELRRLGRPRPVVVDLGTGSGAIALALADEGPEAEIWATDVCGAALDVATANLAGLGGRAATRVRLVPGSWFSALPPELAGRVDLVVSNPPYVAEADEVEPEVASWEPAGALWSGPTGLEATEVILAGAPRWLARPGVVVLEVASDRAGETAAVARAHGFVASLHPDLAGRERVLVGRLECL
jgi:release factor glutamine methyltransferase